MDTLLLVPNYGHDYFQPPRGMMYISSFLKKKGHSVDVVNLNHYPETKLREVLKAKTYDLVGTGGLYRQMSEMDSMFQTVRELSPGARVFLGGAMATADPEFVLSQVNSDFVVLGEGELTLHLMLETLKKGKDFREATGIAYMKDGKFVKTAPTPLVDNLDEFPMPDYEAFEWGKYFENYCPTFKDQSLRALRGNDYIPRPGYIVASRDCMARCTFCYRITDSQFRVRTVGNFVEEVQYLIDNYKINYLEILDEMFVVSKDRTVAFCKELKKIGLPWTCQARVSMLNDDTMALLKDSGCYLLSMGFESGSPEVLLSMKKGASPAQIDRAIQGCIKHKLCIQGNFIFGDPAETLETMQETINFYRKYHIYFGFSYVNPYPGTPLYHDLIKAGKIKDRRRLFESTESVLYNMTKLSDMDFRYMLKKVWYESYKHNNNLFSRVVVKGKDAQGRYMLDIYCSHCKGLNEDCHLNLNLPAGFEVLVVCKHCYQRTFIDRTDIRFFNFEMFAYRIYYLYIMRWMVINPSTFRFFAGLRTLAASIKKLFNFRSRENYSITV